MALSASGGTTTCQSIVLPFFLAFLGADGTGIDRKERFGRWRAVDRKKWFGLTSRFISG